MTNRQRLEELMSMLGVPGMHGRETDVGGGSIDPDAAFVLDDSEVVYRCLLWDAQPEGYDFWEGVHDMLGDFRSSGRTDLGKFIDEWRRGAA